MHPVASTHPRHPHPRHHGHRQAKPAPGGAFMATAYYPAFDRMNGGVTTRCGHHVHSVEAARRDGRPVTAAVDPRVIKLGTIFSLKQFPGLKFLADDTGGRIKGRRIDIQMDTRDEAMAWGRRQVTKV